MAKDSVSTLRLTPEQREKLAGLAEAIGVSRGEVMRRLIEVADVDVVLLPRRDGVRAPLVMGAV